MRTDLATLKQSNAPAKIRFSTSRLFVYFAVRSAKSSKDTNLPFVCENLKLLIDFNPNDKKAPTELSLSGGTIKISPEEIFDIYPLVPELKLKIPKGDSLNVAQKLTLKANLSICLETNGEISLFGGKK